MKRVTLRAIEGKGWKEDENKTNMSYRRYRCRDSFNVAQIENYEKGDSCIAFACL